MTMQSGASTLGAPRSGRVPAFESDDERDRILVVEHQPIVALDLQRTLREAGYRAIGPAATLGEIQRLIEQGPIDCAVVDIDVNRRTPLPVADLLAFADVPFAFLTNREGGEHSAAARRQTPGAKALHQVRTDGGRRTGDEAALRPCGQRRYEAPGDIAAGLAENFSTAVTQPARAVINGPHLCRVHSFPANWASTTADRSSCTATGATY